MFQSPFGVYISLTLSLKALDFSILKLAFSWQKIFLHVPHIQIVKKIIFLLFFLMRGKKENLFFVTLYLIKGYNIILSPNYIISIKFYMLLSHTLIHN